MRFRPHAATIAIVIGALLPTDGAAQTIGFVYGLARPTYSPTPLSLYGVAVDATGQLVPVAGFPILTGGIGGGINPEMVFFDAAGGRLYAVNDASSTVSAWSVNNTTGALTSLPFSPIALPAGFAAGCLAVGPSGSVLVVGGQANRVASYNIGGSTAGQATGSPFFTGTAQPSSCTFSRDGAFFYTGGSGGVCCSVFAGFSVDQSTGVLTPLAGSPFDAGVIPMGLQADSDGRLFAAATFTGSLDSRLAAFTTSSGIPTAVAGNPFANGQLGGFHGLLHPAGYYLTTAWDDIGVFRISGSGSGTTLTAVTGSPFQSGGGSMASSSASVVDSSGHFIVTSNGDSRNLTLSGFNPTTGALTPLQTTPVGSQGAGGQIIGLAFAPVSGSPIGGTITGQVRNALTAAPIRNARIAFEPGGFSTTTDASGRYALFFPAGTYTPTASAAGYVTGSVGGIAVANSEMHTQDFALPRVAASGDFDGDRKADITTFRPSSGVWYSLQSGSSGTTYLAQAWGLSTDVAVPGDYDGDGKIDLGVFRPSTGVWYILQSSTNYTTYVAQTWGLGTDIAVPADYDGDGKTDFGVFRPSTGYWYVLQSSANDTTYIAEQWGLSTDVPVPGDYDGDGKTDLGLYRPSTGYWYILHSSANDTTYIAQQWGLGTDIPAPGDYDGDGKNDLAVYRPSTGYWYILQSSTNLTTYAAYQWGLSTDIPIRGDYDGDGKTDLGLYRPSTGYWYILQSSTNFTTYIAQQWGLSSDIPVLQR